MRSRLTKGISSVLKAPLRVMLSCAPIRRRIVFEIARKYYDDLDIVVPLPGGIKCPMVSEQHWVSFDNIFCEGEYDGLLEDIPLPKTWLDLGCHAGHFTLLLASLWARQKDTPGWRALLIDADSRSKEVIKRINSLNHFDSQQISFLHGAISEETTEVMFSENLHMTSEIALKTSREIRAHRVACIREPDILNRMPPPYDLVKVDIEGAEYDFLKCYTGILSQARYFIFEWHSWHRGGAGREQLVGLAERLDFRVLSECHSDRVIQRNGQPERCGTILMENRG
jgi:FkbM family methyltransferase